MTRQAGRGSLNRASAVAAAAGAAGRALDTEGLDGKRLHMVMGARLVIRDEVWQTNSGGEQGSPV